MITQQFDLNLIPDSAPVIVHVDQYDIGAGRLVMELYEGDEPYTPTAATVQIQGTKPDGHSFLYDAVVNGNVVTSDLKEQMTTCAGDVRTQVVVRENSGRTGSFAFILRVQRSALPADSDMSESDLAAVEELIETAAGIVEDATDAAQDAEAWAQGTRGGSPVGPTDPTYEHNAAYWAAYAEQYSQGALHFKLSITFEQLPVSGMVSGDMYNITNDFVTDGRFEEGAGHHVKGGTNVAYTDNDKWDILALPMIPTMTASEQGIGRPDGMTADVTQGVFRAKGVAISCAINPSGTERGANWLMYGGAVVTPDAVQLYKVYIDGKPTLWTWDTTEQEYVKVSADGGGGASDLDDLGDVEITNPQDGEALIYDAATGKWVNSAGGGGGIPLANPTNISITNQDEAAAICWTDPPNIIVDMETIATWAGTLVVRKAGAAPQGKTDGVIVVDSRVRDQYASTGFVDTGLTNGVTYYYGIFPYTTQNVYNYNSVSQFTPAAIYPTAVSDLAASGGNAQATVTWTTPADASSVNIVVSATGEAGRTFTAATSPLTVTGLTNDTTYTVKAVSVNAKGRTTESAGVTVTPQSDITYQGWLAAGGVIGSYSSLADVLADEIAVRKLMTIHAAVDYLCTAHSDSAMISTILNNDIAAKWITLRAYAEDKLVETFPTIAASADKYGYGEWALIDNVWQPKGNVPVMTSNTAPYGTASAYQVFDGNASTTANGTDFSYNFVNPVCPKSFACKNASGQDISGATLQASNDGSTWVTPVSGAFYLYLRLHFSSSVTVATMQFYGRELNVSVPAMTSNTAPYGVASASHIYDTEHDAWYAFSSEDNRGVWLGGTSNFNECWIKYDFKIPTVVKYFYIKKYYDSNGYRVKNFKIQGSNDNNEWVDLLTDIVPNTGADWSINTYSINNNNPYRYYRLYIIDSYKLNNPATLRRIQFYGFDYSEYDWDTDHPRHYIYDHGVELENITLAGTATKEEFDIKLSAANAQASATINTTAYTAMGGKVGRYGSGTNQLICGSASSNFSATNMPDRNGIDITNVNSSVAVGVKQTANGTFTAEEIWVA